MTQWAAAMLVAVLVMAACQTATPSDAPPAQAASEPTAVVVVPSRTPPPTSTVAPELSPVPTETAVAVAEAPTATAAPVEPTATAAPVVVQPPVRLVIPGLKIDTPVIPMSWRVVDTANGPVSEWVIPEIEAGHHINSVSLGEPGNLVLSGHNNIYSKVFESISRSWSNDERIAVDKFTDRSDVLNGQTIQLFGADGQIVEYQVEEFYRLRDTGVSTEQRIANARFMDPTDDQRVTIITCWPPWNNTHRLVVIARPAQAQ